MLNQQLGRHAVGQDTLTAICAAILRSGAEVALWAPYKAHSLGVAATAACPIQSTSPFACSWLSVSIGDVRSGLVARSASRASGQQRRLNHTILWRAGRALSASLDLAARRGPPLFYTWPKPGGRGDPYLGAAHGLVGIVHALLHCWCVRGLHSRPRPCSNTIAPRTRAATSPQCGPGGSLLGSAMQTGFWSNELVGISVSPLACGHAAVAGLTLPACFGQSFSPQGAPALY
jgi:hypothetical protein